MKPYFSGLAKVEFLEGEVEDGLPVFHLLEDLTFYIGKHAITAPKGTRGNGASFPRFYRAFMSPVDPRVLRASIIHDYLYGEGRKAGSRWKADCVYYSACRVCGLSKNEAAKQWILLRIFGSKQFKRR